MNLWQYFYTIESDGSTTYFYHWTDLHVDWNHPVLVVVDPDREKSHQFGEENCFQWHQKDVCHPDPVLQCLVESFDSQWQVDEDSSHH